MKLSSVTLGRFLPLPWIERSARWAWELWSRATSLASWSWHLARKWWWGVQIRSMREESYRSSWTRHR